MKDFGMGHGIREAPCAGLCTKQEIIGPRDAGFIHEHLLVWPELDERQFAVLD
jgi:hypothetical protein